MKIARLVVLQNIEREGPGLFYNLASLRDIRCLTIRLYLGEKIPHLLSNDCLLVMGGPMGVSDIYKDKYPWLLDELHTIKFAIQNKIKVVGVCLGAQLLCYAAGGDVEPLISAKSNKEISEIGWDRIYGLDKIHPLSLLIDENFYVLHWHEDRLILSEDSTLLASSKICKEQLFAIDKYAIGIQFHVEIYKDMINKWILEDQAFIESSLGYNGVETLFRQQQKYGERSLHNRIKFINGLYDYLELN